MNVAGIVLCGGQSQRMGQAKATLSFGSELMLPRVVRLLQEAVDPVIVVAAPRQELPPLPASVGVVRDEQEFRGPLAGLAGGFASLPDAIEAAYASSCDVPLLRPAFVRRVIELLGDFDVAVPVTGGMPHPLAAAYHRRVVPHIQELLKSERLRLGELLAAARSRYVTADELREVDPELASLRNVNTPEDYAAALATCFPQTRPNQR
jgi:molybdopterin-guanine dinucleotide biosynthesis protein A